MLGVRCNIYGVWKIFKRPIHATSFKNSTSKQARIFAKLMTGSSRKRKNWYDVELSAKAPVLPKSNDFQKGSEKRVHVLNNLFMRTITDVLATGEVAPYLLGRGLSITKVKVLSDYSAVNVYWTAKEIYDSELKKLLEEAGFDLRHHLCQLHVLGKVPRINFVPDKVQVIVEQTLQCLEKARLIDMYEPSDIAKSFKSENILTTQLDPETLAKITEDGNFEDDLDLPPMTHNVLGLDHAFIMSKIEAGIKKSEARHRQSTASDDDRVHPFKQNIDAREPSFSRSDIAKYIAKQKMQRKKMLQALKRELLEEVELQNLNEEQDEEDVDVDEDIIEEFNARKNELY